MSELTPNDELLLGNILAQAKAATTMLEFCKDALKPYEEVEPELHLASVDVEVARHNANALVCDIQVMFHRFYREKHKEEQ